MMNIKKVTLTCSILTLGVIAGGCTIHEPDPLGDRYRMSVRSALEGQRANPESDMRVASVEEVDGTAAVNLAEKYQKSFEAEAEVQPQALFEFGD